jgi:hypothetical protein
MRMSVLNVCMLTFGVYNLDLGMQEAIQCEHVTAKDNIRFNILFFFFPRVRAGWTLLLLSREAHTPIFPVGPGVFAS